MTREQAIQLSNEIRGRFDSPFSILDKTRIEELYSVVLGKRFRKTSCQQCYHDALIEICLYLKNHNTMANQKKYIMRAGFIIHSPIFDGGKVYTNDNLTDDVAERYMEMFPNKKSMFDKNPNYTEPTEVKVETKPKTKRKKK